MNRLLDLLATAALLAAVVAINDTLEVWTGQAVYDLDGPLIPARLTDAELAALAGGDR